MDYKMIVLDMDDTLLTDNHTISERNRKAIKEAQEQGKYVVLASGRPTFGMLNYAKNLELDKYNSYIISHNGAQITRMNDEKCLFQQTISVEDIHALYDFSVREKTAFITYDDTTIFGDKDSKYIDIESELTGMKYNKVADFKATVDFPCVKCLLLEEPTYLKEVFNKIKTVHTDKSISMSKPFFLEVMPTGIDKASAIKRLIADLDIKQEEVIAVGNAGNDLAMVQFAGLGAWVDNVDEELRELSDIIVSSNNNDGVAEVIEQYVLKTESVI